jgi:hypothetical protein
MRSPNDARAAIAASFSAGSASRSIRSPSSDRFLSAPTAVIAAFATSASSSSTSSRSSRSKASGRIDSRRAASSAAGGRRALLFDHFRQQQLRGIEVLRPARARQERDDGRLDREVLEVTKRLDRSSGSIGSNSVRYNSASVRTPRSGSFTSASI